MMSTNRIVVFTVLSLIYLIAAASVFASEDRIELQIRPVSGNIYHVSGDIIGGAKRGNINLSFTDIYADAEGLAGRISAPKVFDSNGSEIPLKKFTEGEWVSAEPFSAFTYNIRLDPPNPLIVAPHISWNYGSFSLIKMSDVIPDLKASSYVLKLDIPDGFQIATAEKALGGKQFQFEERQNAVFVIGASARGGNDGLRSQFRQIRRTRVDVSVAGAWQFDDQVVADMAVEIIDEYKRIFGLIPQKRIQINLLPFPGDSENDRWRAETQGATVTIVSSQTSSRARAGQLLHEQLRHELFHLWIPGALNLKGDYAWFYEGFARYQALKAGVWLGRIGFGDYLRSVSQAIEIGATENNDVSLIELSSNQWFAGPGRVAARGMMIAFISDMLFLSETNGKKSVLNITNEILRKHRNTGPKANAIEAIENQFAAYSFLRPVFENNVKRSEAVDWSGIVGPAGLKAVQSAERFRLIVGEKPDRKQKALLNKLGYNRWKKFADRSL